MSRHRSSLDNIQSTGVRGRLTTRRLASHSRTRSIDYSYDGIILFKFCVNIVNVNLY